MNNVVLIGRLTKKPEIDYTPSNKAVSHFTLAVDRPTKNGEKQGADFIRCVAWEKRAELCERWLDKGSQVGIRGRITTGSYKGDDGKTIYTTDITIEEIEFLGKGKSEEPAEPQVDSFVAAEDDIPF